MRSGGGSRRCCHAGDVVPIGSMIGASSAVFFTCCDLAHVGATARQNTGRTRRFTIASITAGNTHDLVGAAELLRRMPTPRRLIADRSYDAKKLREWLAERGCEPVIPPNPTRKHPAAYDLVAYKARNLIERMFCRLKDFRRIATRYDKRVDIYLSSILLAAAVTWWIN
jgi:putative transposase